MPIGIVVNSLSIAIGGVLGAMIGHKLSEELKTKIQMIFGVCSMTMGISTIVLTRNMPAVIFSVIPGTALGVLIHLESKHIPAPVRVCRADLSADDAGDDR